MLTDFQPQESYGHQTERLHQVARKYQLGWRHHLQQQSQLADVVLVLALVIAAGVAIELILRP